MKQAALVLLLTLGAAGCASDTDSAAASNREEYCAGNQASLSLDAEPPAVNRADPVDILIRWQLTDRVSEPAVARLIVGSSGQIEVEVPLLLDLTSQPFLYQGTQLNPFGAGAPAGTVTVLASGTARQGCEAPATATTTFELE